MLACRDEDDSNLESGDLGLGLGLKPGSLPILDALRSKKKELKLSSVVSEKPLIPLNQSKYSKIEQLFRKSKARVYSNSKPTQTDKMNMGHSCTEENEKSSKGLFSEWLFSLRQMFW